MHTSVELSITAGCAALIVILAVVIGASFASRMNRAKARLVSLRPIVALTAFGPVEYELRGEGPLVLVSHGITGGIDQCFGLAQTYLRHEGLRILAVSRFGYGGSALPMDPSPARQADAFAALLDELRIGRLHVMGNSGGAAAAIQFAIRHPDRCSSLYLVSSNFPNSASVPPEPIMRAIFGSNFIYWATIGLFEKGMLEMAGVPLDILARLDRAQREDIVDRILYSGLPITERTDGVLNDLYLSNVDMKRGYDFAGIRAPVMLAHAKDDPAGNYQFAERVKDLIPMCDFIPIASGGHLLLGSEDRLREESCAMIARGG
jgi:2-hydroxy-6-oxonona-2,4-dienedioate hydrolase